MQRSCFNDLCHKVCAATAVRASTVTSKVALAAFAKIYILWIGDIAHKHSQGRTCQTKKALQRQRFFLNRISNCRCSVHHHNFCEVGSGVTIVFAGSVVGAEHPATVRASTNPTTTFFIRFAFTVKICVMFSVLYAEERHRGTALL